MKLVIYGTSDDIVTVEGALTEEFYPRSDEPDGYLAFSDGTVLRISYTTDGIWRIHRYANGTAEFTKHEGAWDNMGLEPVQVEGVGEFDLEGTDVVVLEGEFIWALFGDELKRIGVKA